MKLFDEFWQLYPYGRRKAKKKCQQKYEKLVKKGLHSKIMEALHLQIKAYNIKLKNKAPFIAAWKLSETWLNGECWKDDVIIPPSLPQNRYYNLDSEKSPAEKEKEREQEKINADKAWENLAKLAKINVKEFKKESYEKCKKKYGKIPSSDEET